MAELFLNLNETLVSERAAVTGVTKNHLRNHRRVVLLVLAIVCSFLLATPAFAVDGIKWDGKKYPFRLLDTAKVNSEANPFIIDTAGKLAFFGYLVGAYMTIDLLAYGEKNGLRGLAPAYDGNYFKLTLKVSAGSLAVDSYEIDNCHSEALISVKSAGDAMVGGLTGTCGKISNSSFRGAVSAKGGGTNTVGGLIGVANARWGETDQTLYAVLNGFWLKQPKAGGINRDIAYAKGS